MATAKEVSDAVAVVAQGITDLGTSLTAEIAKLDALIAAAGGGGVNPADLDPIVTNLKAQADTLAQLKTQADNAT